MSVFTHRQFLDILAHVYAEPGDVTRQWVLRDWLMDHDCPQPLADEAILSRPLSPLDIWSFGTGRGSGTGRGIFEAKIMEPGKAYLIHCGDWHTFVGRVVKQVGVSTYLLTAASKIRETRNGDCWYEMAAGDQRLREAAEYAHVRTDMVIPLSIACCEWLGQTPQEAGLKESENHA